MKLQVRIDPVTQWPVEVRSVADDAPPAPGITTMTEAEYQQHTAGIAPPVEQPPTVSIPTCTQRQIRLWLLSQGVTDESVRSMIAAIPDPIQREAALIEFDYATEYKRDHPLVAQIGAALGLTESQIDAGFLAASLL